MTDNRDYLPCSKCGSPYLAGSLNHRCSSEDSATPQRRRHPIGGVSGDQGLTDGPFYGLACGAVVGKTAVTPCPDPYCRECRDQDGEVIDPPYNRSSGDR